MADVRTSAKLRHTTNSIHVVSDSNDDVILLDKDKKNGSMQTTDDSCKLVFFLRLLTFWIKPKWQNFEYKKLLYCIILFIFLWYSVIVENPLNMSITHTIKSHSSYILGLRDYDAIDTPNYLWKFGIAARSDKHDSMEFILTSPSNNKISDYERFQNVQNGHIIWIKELQLLNFVNNILPNIDSYFTLIIATNMAWITPLYYDEDEEYSKKRIFDRLLDSPYLLYLFAENYDFTLYDNPKYKDMIEGIPIGLDFKTPYANPITGYKMFGHAHSPSQMEYEINKLLNDKRKVPPLENRILKVYLDSALDITRNSKYNEYLNTWNIKFGKDWTPKRNYHTIRNNRSHDILQLYSGKDRWRKFWYRAWLTSLLNTKQMDVNKNVDRNLFYMDPTIYQQYDGFVKRSQYVFALSPFGNGLDCHRTWESLLFGNIVIVQTSPLDHLYIKHDLPVVIIQDYNEINETSLKMWYQQYKNKVFLKNNYKLTTDYWWFYIRNKTFSKMYKKTSMS